jgi:hypothetical protein
MLRSLLVMVTVSMLSGCTGSVSPSVAAKVLDAGGPSDGSPDGGGARSGNADAGTPQDAGSPTVSVCAPPVTLFDVSNPTTVVGTGTAASCTESAFSAAVGLGGKIVFNCGGPATIPITSEKAVRIDVDTVIDGGGQITLDGGGLTRILNFEGTNFRVTLTKLVLQRITLTNGKATGTLTFPTAPAPCSQGFQNGGGGAVLVQDGVLVVINSVFTNNQSASPGPDVAGGAIYVIGSASTTIVGSHFSDNMGSNGGAVGSLFSDLTLVNDVFERNQATGSGANSDNLTCPIVGGQRETGSGGNGGAVCIDGGETFTVDVCGCVFSQNRSGALGGGVFRTPDDGQATIIFDRSTLDGNQAVQGGGAMYIHNSLLQIVGTTVSNNSAPGAGGIQADSTTVDFSNSTFWGNTASQGLGGAMALFNNGADGGAVVNCTFGENRSSGGSGYFGAALAGDAPLTLRNTVFQNNLTQDSGSAMACAMADLIGSGNVQWPEFKPVGGAADSPCTPGILFADAMLGVLADNGGPTSTATPETGSPAIGLGTKCPSTDQRGRPRSASTCTAGAVEPP